MEALWLAAVSVLQEMASLQILVDTLDVALHSGAIFANQVSVTSEQDLLKTKVEKMRHKLALL